jgi:hypothetical protein
LSRDVVHNYCLECVKKIYTPLIVLGSESRFCEECEIGDYEGKCGENIKDVRVSIRKSKLRKRILINLKSHIRLPQSNPSKAKTKSFLAAPTISDIQRLAEGN